MTDIDKARERVYDAVRWLPPSVIHQLFKELSEETAKLSVRYDRELAEIICGGG